MISDKFVDAFEELLAIPKNKHLLCILVIYTIKPTYMDFNYPTNSFYRDNINIKEYYEVEYWANKFGVKPGQLKEAVQAVGTSPKDVEVELTKQLLIN